MSALEIGIADAWHPVNLATPLVFALFLLYSAKQRNAHLYFGVSFLIGSYLTRFLLVTGSLDGWLTLPLIQQMVRWSLVLLSAGLLGYGVYLLKLWYRFRIKKIPFQLNLCKPLPLRIKTVLKIISLILSAFILGGLLVITSSMVSSDYGIFIMLLHNSGPQAASFWNGNILLYGLGCNVFVILIWLLIGFRFFAQSSKFIEKVYPRILICSSGFYIAIAVGLFYQFLKS